jgi:hypothetical protein
MTKQERYDALQEKLDVYEGALDYAQSLVDTFDGAEISGLKGVHDKAYAIVEFLEEKIEKTEGYMDNIEL